MLSFSKYSVATIHFRDFVKRPEFFRFCISILREGVVFALGALIILLSIDAILPGTTSIHSATVFLVAGIGLALALERFLVVRLRDDASFIERHSSVKRKRGEIVLAVLFVLWTILLFGNAAIGFPLPIIVGLLVSLIVLLRMFFSIVFPKE